MRSCFVRRKAWAIGPWVVALGLGCSAIVEPDVDRLTVDSAIGNDGGAECRPGCSDDVETRCTNEGAVVTECSAGCADATRCRELVPSNVDGALFARDAEDLVVDRPGLTFDTTSCSAAGLRTDVVPQTNGPSLCVLQVRDLRVERSAVLRVQGSLPLVVLAAGDVEVRGAIDASAEHERAGAGGSQGGRASEADGSGWAPGIAGGGGVTFDDGGGGGGGGCGAGCIVVRNQSGTLPPGTTSTWSPRDTGVSIATVELR